MANTKKEEKVTKPTKNEKIIEAAKKVGSKSNNVIGLDQMMMVEYLKDFGTQKKGKVRRMGAIKAQFFADEGVVKVLNEAQKG